MNHQQQKTQTPLPALIEYWINVASNKKTNRESKDAVLLHLKNIRDIIDDTLLMTEKYNQHENMSTRRHPFRSQKRL